MRTSPLRKLAYCAAALMTLGINCLGVAMAQVDEQHTAVSTLAGIIDSITGKVEWRANTNVKPVSLDFRTDLGKSLRPGNAVRLGSITSSITLRLFRHKNPDLVRTLRGTLTWFPIANVGIPIGDQRVADLQNYARIGGINRHRNPSPSSVTPIPDSAIRPPAGGAPLVVRWRPFRGVGTFALFPARSASGVASVSIWKQDVIDLSRGVLPSPVAGSLTAAFRTLTMSERDGARCRMLYRLPAGASAPAEPSVVATATFTVLSSEEEAELERKLADWDRKGETGLLRHVGRARILNEYKLTWDELEEYDAALREAPESAFLRAAAVRMHTEVGDYLGARLIRKGAIACESGIAK